MKPKRLNLKRKPFIPFGTPPEPSLKPRCPKSCRFKIYGEKCPAMFCRYDVKEFRNRKLNDLRLEIEITIGEINGL